MGVCVWGELGHVGCIQSRVLLLFATARSVVKSVKVPVVEVV